MNPIYKKINTSSIVQILDIDEILNTGQGGNK